MVLFRLGCGWSNAININDDNYTLNVWGGIDRERRDAFYSGTKAFRDQSMQWIDGELQWTVTEDYQAQKMAETKKSMYVLPKNAFVKLLIQEAIQEQNMSTAIASLNGMGGIMPDVIFKSTSVTFALQILGGIELSFSQTTAMFTNGDYAFYPYEYASISAAIRAGIGMDVSLSEGRSVGIGYSKTDKSDPTSMEGASTIVGILWSLKAPAGMSIGGTLSISSDWTLISLDGGFGIGPSVLGGIKYSLNENEKQQFNNTWLLTKPYIKTADRPVYDLMLQWFNKY